ncbi:N-acetylmuramic acid 6-phosphate etherase [Staphylococcus xylosus]|uniref:N-acetylmuramic acid 6-phosphate etherase n=1 Tax=Staphylococcus xylosus TaxID=1288 RepID=UPI001071A89D|nr:N-acetylmuramic acid 6-phosphate etherase [Staphylococcus xylosus]MBF0811534.1 N-acetylmuramic acid 6-phosphate etherase [Staphylococcus xylosus]TFV20345.1 N-acetylmuramic acid 6-phosphate etherase [Staphylococcus xylosus]USC86436.1 N-acetylmuramic acid 6-phosphate etherase [Staphylococcus xylosus]
MNKSITESRNEATMHLDEMTIQQALETMNAEDQKVPEQIKVILPELTKVIEITTHQFKQGGRIIYMGAGTSGRLGVLDAAECVPTFNTNTNEVIGLIAGGQRAMTVAVEGAEDDEILAHEDLKHIHLCEKDVVIGIAASGSTPYVKGGLKFANKVGAYTVAISCNVDTQISKLAQFPIEVNVGPEVLTGSTRLKSGTAQKLILNMISTITMVGVGKVYDNLMVDVKATNQKLIDRSIRIIQDICDTSYEQSQILYEEAEQNLKVAVVMHLCNISKEEALRRLQENDNIIKQAIKD